MPERGIVSLMTRRALFCLPLAGILRAKEPCPPADVSALANSLADSYNLWSRRANEDTKLRPGMIDVRLFQLWHEEVRPKFRALDRMVRG